MSRSWLIGKIVFSVLGIYTLNRALLGVKILTVSRAIADGGNAYSAVIRQLVILAVGCLLAYSWLFRSDWIIRKTIGKQDEKALEVSRIWAAEAFRLAMVFSGVLILLLGFWGLRRDLGTILKCMRVLPEMIVHRYVDMVFDKPLIWWIWCVAFVFEFVIAIYMVLGAPRYVRWQVRRARTRGEVQGIVKIGEDMVDMRNIAKIVLVGVAMYILTGILFSVVSMIIAMIAGGSFLLLGILHLGMLALVGAILLCWFGSWGDRIAVKVVGKTPAQSQPVDYLGAAFRLACVVAGMILVKTMLPHMTMILYRLFSLDWAMDSTKNVHLLMRDVISVVVLGAVAVYCLYGAPHFVRWQVKKTVEQCRKLEAFEKKAG